MTILLVSCGTLTVLVRNSEAVTTGLFRYASEGLALMRSLPARRALLPESSRSFRCASLVSARVMLLSGTALCLSRLSLLILLDAADVSLFPDRSAVDRCVPVISRLVRGLRSEVVTRPVPIDCLRSELSRTLCSGVVRVAGALSTVFGSTVLTASRREDVANLSVLPVLRSGVLAASVRVDRVTVTVLLLSAGLYPLFTSADCTLRPLLVVTVRRSVDRLAVTDLEPLPAVPLLLTSTVRGRETTRVLLSETRGDGAEDDLEEEETRGLLCG